MATASPTRRRCGSRAVRAAATWSTSPTVSCGPSTTASTPPTTTTACASAPTGKAIKESIPVNGGQWGLTQDDWGKVWFVNAGNETGPVHFQQHIIYGQFSAPNELIGQYKVVWPIARVPDTQGGPGQLRPDNTLNHFTATSGQDIFRGDRLPADLRGNLLFAEPVGRLIRRTLITVEDGVTRLANAYEDQHGEFIRATDPLFRPVNMITAPDGTLYIVDMYRGIIQQANWTRKGTYLREQIEAHELQKEIGRGRIYRLRHEGFEPGPQAAHARRNSRRSGCSTCRIPMAGGATPRRSCSSCVAISRSCPRSRNSRAATPPIPARACTRCGRSTVSARSMTNSSCAR